MHWGDSVSPARFLTRTGDILPGVRRVVQVPSPAPGADWSITVPGGVQWNILALTSTLTTSATVANRLPGLTVAIDGVTTWHVQSNANLVASSSVTVNSFSGIQYPFYGGAGTYMLETLPPGPYPAATEIGSSTTAISAADQWSGVALYIEEYYFTDNVLTERVVQWEAFERAERQAVVAAMQAAGLLTQKTPPSG